MYKIIIIKELMITINQIREMKKILDHFFSLFLSESNFKDAELMQYLIPEGVGPSLNT